MVYFDFFETERVLMCMPFLSHIRVIWFVPNDYRMQWAPYVNHMFWFTYNHHMISTCLQTKINIWESYNNYITIICKSSYFYLMIAIWIEHHMLTTNIIFGTLVKFAVTHSINPMISFKETLSIVTMYRSPSYLYEMWLLCNCLENTI